MFVSFHFDHWLIAVTQCASEDIDRTSSKWFIFHTLEIDAEVSCSGGQLTLCDLATAISSLYAVYTITLGVCMRLILRQSLSP